MSKICPKFCCFFWPTNLFGEGPQLQTKFSKFGSPSHICLKFCDDWPSNLGDQALKKQHRFRIGCTAAELMHGMAAVIKKSRNKWHQQNRIAHITSQLPRGYNDGIKASRNHTGWNSHAQTPHQRWNHDLILAATNPQSERWADQCRNDLNYQTCHDVATHTINAL